MQSKIKNLFSDKKKIPLFYIESGSRLWGIDSPDSDYDIRGFHIQQKEHYFSFEKNKEIIEVMDGNFDFISYDIDKMFGLLAKSNPSVLEWIRSDIIYLNNLPNWDDFQEQIVVNYDFRALYYHYISLAKGHYNLLITDKKFTYKTMFYCLRGLLAADLASKHIMPELQIDRLLLQFETQNDIIKIAKETIETKRTQKEGQVIEQNKKSKFLKSIDDYIKELLCIDVKNSNNQEALNKILKDYNYAIKAKYYS